MHRLALVVLLAACGTEGTDPISDELPDGDVSTDPPVGSCADATRHSDFAWIQDHVFTPTCTGAPCHDATEPTLSLTKGNAYVSLVNQPTESLSGWTRVVPGSPQTSYLMVALGREPGPEPNSGFMPVDAEPLCAEKLDALERWIAQGALP